MNDDTPPRDPTEPALDAWLAQHVRDLDARLSDHLDIEAGLRDTHLPDRVARLDMELDVALDVDAGLQATTPSHAEGFAATVKNEPEEARHAFALFRQFAADISVPERLRLRSAISSEDLGEIYWSAAEHLALTVLNDQELDHLINYLNDMQNWINQAEHVDISGVSRTQAMAAFACLDRLKSVRAVVKQLASPFPSFIRPQLIREDEWWWDQMRFPLTAAVLETAETLTQAMEVAFHQEDNPTRFGTRRRASRTNRQLIDAAREMHTVLIENAAISLTMLVNDMAILRSEGGEPEGSESLSIGVAKFVDAVEYSITARDEFVLRSVFEICDSLLTDFTNVDLTGTRLDGVSLVGVRWSTVTTRWPPGWLHRILDISVPIEKGPTPELYEVRGDPHIRHTVH